MTRMLARWSLALLLVGVAVERPAAFLKLGVSVSGRTVPLRWTQQPVRYFVTNRDVPDVSAAQLRAAAERANRVWQDVTTSAAAFEFVGFVGAEPFDEDGIVTLGFQDRPELDRTLGSTGFVVDVISGEIIEAGILLNSAFPWSVSPDGEPGRYDVESIVLHELGHLSGLNHSLLGETEMTSGRRRVTAAESVMFPIAFSAGNIDGRTLRADDVAGISDLYPAGGFSTLTGSIHGRVTLDGRGLYGAHLVAFHPSSGVLVGSFSLTTSGEFVLAGLAPGPHVLRVEPLDDAPVESFFGDPLLLDTAFEVTYFERLEIVPAGGNTGPIEIRVRSR